MDPKCRIIIFRSIQVKAVWLIAWQDILQKQIVKLHDLRVKAFSLLGDNTMICTFMQTSPFLVLSTFNILPATTAGQCCVPDYPSTNTHITQIEMDILSSN